MHNEYEQPPRDEDTYDDDDIPTGMPGEGEPEPAPLGGSEDADDAPEHGEDAMPGIPGEDEPEISG